LGKKFRFRSLIDWEFRIDARDRWRDPFSANEKQYIQDLMRACAMPPPVGQVYNYAIPAAAGRQPATCLLGCTAARRVSVLPQIFSFFPSKSRLDMDLTEKSWKLFYTLLCLSTLLLLVRKVLMKSVSKLFNLQTILKLGSWKVR